MSEAGSPSKQIDIRPATAADAWTIRLMVWRARIGPTGLNWRRFLVAELSGCIVGVVQVKPHRDGSRELASLAVAPKWQGQGIGSALVRALLARESRPLFLFCRRELASYYARFGFALSPGAKLPFSLARLLRLANLASRPLSWLAGRTVVIVAMRLDGLLADSEGLAAARSNQGG